MRPLLAKQLGNKREADVLSSDCQSVDLFIHRLRSLTVRLIKYWPESDHMYFSVFLSPRSDRVWRLIHFTGGLRGASIIDSLDTLYIMGLMEEYNDAKEWVKNSLDLNSVSEPTSLWATPHDLDFVVCLMWFLTRSESSCVFSCQRTFVQTFYSPVHGVQVHNNVVTFDVRKFCFHQLSPWVSLFKNVCAAPPWRNIQYFCVSLLWTPSVQNDSLWKSFAFLRPPETTSCPFGGVHPHFGNHWCPCPSLWF